MLEKQDSVKYSFSFEKDSSYKDKTLLNVISNGKFSLLIKKIDDLNKNYKFINLDYQQQGVKDPLVFSPIEWQYNRELNIAGIKSKENFKPIFDKYKNKYRTAANKSVFLTVEKLYFNTPLGLESDMLSNGVCILFFINHDNDFQKGKTYKGLNFISLPLNLPLKTTFECKSIDDQHIELEGWIDLHEENLDVLLKSQSFINHAKEYHISQDFQISSCINIKLEKLTKTVLEGKFTSTIKGGNKLLEEIKFEICSTSYKFQNQVYNTHKGKNYTYTEWIAFEKEKHKNKEQESILQQEKRSAQDPNLNTALFLFFAAVGFFLLSLFMLWVLHNYY